MKLRLLSGSGVLCLTVIYAACFTARSDSSSLHREHDKDLAIWFSPTAAEVCLHTAGKSGAATARFELLDNTDTVIAKTERTAELAGDTHLRARLAIDVSALDDSARAILKWNRLRYTLTGEDETRSDTVTVSDAMPDPFGLRLTAAESAEPGGPYCVAVHASGPNTHEDISGVMVRAILETGGSIQSQSELTTDEEGLASFVLPIKVDSPESATLVINAFKDGAFETQTLSVRVRYDASITISTDKPLYQPGQTIHSRTLILAKDSHQALADGEVHFKLNNSRNETVATATERTDRFGVASHDFALADEVDLGVYTLTVAATSLSSQQTKIEVSRYELPSFAVAAEPDKRFYLKGETALVTLRADYLFGKTVESGRAVIVAEAASPGSTSASKSGHFDGVISHGRAEIRIGPLRAPGDNYYYKFIDHAYTAFVTDASTGRTEQTRFTLRASRHALHVYVRSSDGNLRLPVQFYVSTFFPDGSPAQCELKLDIDGGKHSATVRTNRYGLAKVATTYVAPAERDKYYRQILIRARARDDQDRTGTAELSLSYYNAYPLRVSTDRSIYRKGEEVRVDVLTSPREKLIRLEATKDGRVISAETLGTLEGRASATLPWNSLFDGPITLAAYPLEKYTWRELANRTADDSPEVAYSYFTPALTTILFQPSVALNVSAQLTRQTVKPGEEAEVEIRVTDHAGFPVETCLGVSVTDKAVNALAGSTTATSAGQLGDYYRSRSGYPEEVAGVTLSDLLSLDFTRPIPEELALVGEMILEHLKDDLNRASSRYFEPHPLQLYEPLFSATREHIAQDVTAYYAQRRDYPSQTAQLRSLSTSAHRDPWGIVYRFSMKPTKIELQSWNGKLKDDGWWKTRKKWTATRTIEAASAGPDRMFETADDFHFDIMSVPEKPLEGRAGALYGRIFGDRRADDVRVRAIQIETGANTEIVTENNGRFQMVGLEPGMYGLRFDADGSTQYEVVDVIVTAGAATEINAYLLQGTGPSLVFTTNHAFSRDAKQRHPDSILSAAIITSIGGRRGQFPRTFYSALRGGLTAGYLGGVAKYANIQNALIVSGAVAAGGGGTAGKGDNDDAPIATPRLRQHFPETLVWQPQVITDAAGTARLKFPVADSITTWQLAVVGSTIDGRLGSNTAEIRAFQDFFAEPHLPPSLTEGDEISLPVLLRNYTDQTQSVSLTLEPDDWFNVDGENTANLNVATNLAARADFQLRVIKPGDFQARVTATGAGASDAIEKPLRVSYDGQEVVASQGDLLDRISSYDVDIPVEAIGGSASAVLKIYPNVLSKALGAIEGLARRPWGCLEQTLSTTYGNVVLLSYLKTHGKRSSSVLEWEKVEAEARRNLQDGYQRVMSFRAEDDGYSYFGDKAGDIALTAYALQFFSDAREFIGISTGKLGLAQRWLLTKQEQDGSWKINKSYWEKSKKPYATTAYVARALAISGYQGSKLQRAFAYLDRHEKEMSDPYSLALYALAARAAGDQNRVAALSARLVSLVERDKNGAHWRSPDRTLFYGRGRGGEIETTALAVQVLAAQDSNDAVGRLINEALLYLARMRDAEGAWHSTQATLLALQALMGSADATEVSSSIDVTLNGSHFETIDLSQRTASDSTPVELDLTPRLQGGVNRVGLQSTRGRPGVQLVSRYFVRWAPVTPTQAQRKEINLGVTTDKTQAAVGERVTYDVSLKRTDWRSSGMSIAEVGLPPGVEVDRGTLDPLVTRRTISKYSITPDRVIFYLWPDQATTRFSFVMRPRLPMNALTSLSLAYDYYNPEQRHVVRPMRMIVQ